MGDDLPILPSLGLGSPIRATVIDGRLKGYTHSGGKSQYFVHTGAVCLDVDAVDGGISAAVFQPAWTRSTIRSEL